MKFRSKTVIGVVCIQSVCLAFLVLALLSEMRKACHEQVVLRTDLTERLLSSAARDAMVGYDSSALQGLSQDMVSAGKVSWVQFVDDRGRQMAMAGVKPPATEPGSPQPEVELSRSSDIAVSGQSYGSVRFGVPLAEVVALSTAVRNQALAIAGSVLVGMVLLSVLLARWLTQRLNDLAVASRSIEAGDLSIQLLEQGADELADTARSFNHMAQRLAQVSQERAQAMDELRHLAYRDPLTGAQNRRSFMAALETEFNRQQRSGEAASLLMLDIDHFKRVNDTWGHDVGDEVLKHLVAVLQLNLRRIDTLGRLGGEEFAVLLPGTALQGALELADRLRAAVAASPARVPSPPEGGSDPGGVAFTISVGVAEMAQGCLQAADALKHADSAMYEAKRTGRNRVCPFVPDAAAQPSLTAA